MNSQQTITLTNTSRPEYALPPVLTFAWANFKGSLRNRVMMATTMFTPLLLLGLFWLMTTAGKSQPSSAAGANFDMMAFIFPGIIVFTVIQAGGPHATTIVNWREQGIFKRLFCTPVPLWQLVLGRALSQAVLALMQAALVLVVGLALTHLSVSWIGILLAFGVLALGCICFIALGSVIAGLIRNVAVATSLYTFLIIPMLFFGDSMMPASIMPDFAQKIGAFLPTAMITSLVRSLMATGTLPANAAASLIGLGIYTVIFVILSIRVFRWQ